MIPTVIVLFLGAISWIVLDDIEAKDADRDGARRSPRSSSPGASTTPRQGVTSRELHVPVDRQLEIQLRALDVLHSFWVPEWRIKRDLVPGAPGASIDDDIVVTPNKEGTFSLICTELCGVGHSTMRAPVVVETEAEFDAVGRRAGPDPAGEPPAATASPRRSRPHEPERGDLR